jgi:hypothetical protein
MFGSERLLEAYLGHREIGTKERIRDAFGAFRGRISNH